MTINQGAQNLISDQIEYERRMQRMERALQAVIPVGIIQQYSLEIAPNGWQLCDGSVAASQALLAALDLAGRPYGGSAGAGLVPDLRGRVTVGKGTHTEVDALGENDGLAVGSRKAKHRHGKGTLAIAAGGSHGHDLLMKGGGTVGVADNNDRPPRMFGGSNYTLSGKVVANNHAHPSSEFSGEVGDTNGPLDGPAFIVINYIIKI